MDDNMTQTELYLFLATVARNIRAEAETVEAAAKVVDDLADALKPSKD